MTGGVAIIGTVVIGFALISRRVGPSIISSPMIFVAAGLITGDQVFAIVDLGLELDAIDVIGEATLGVLLFADASRINLRSLRREYELPARLLGIGLPLTVAATTGVLALLIDGIDIWHAALIAAILSPTDAALGQEVVSDTSVPARIRQGLTVESGLNDGLIVPAVALFLTFAVDDEEVDSAGFWISFFVRQIGLGVVVGLAIGATGAFLLNRSERAQSLDGVWGQLAVLSLAITTLAATIEAGGNGFIATFVAGLAFGHVAERAEHLGEFTEDTAQLAAAVSFFLFGNLLLGPALDDFSVTIVICALATLTIARMVPVAVALIGTGSAVATRAFVGWFGPRGLASILFGLLLLEEELEGADKLFAVVAWTVTLSVVLHGATAAFGARRYGAWWNAMPHEEQMEMPEAIEVEEQRARRS